MKTNTCLILTLFAAVGCSSSSDDDSSAPPSDAATSDAQSSDADSASSDATDADADQEACLPRGAFCGAGATGSCCSHMCAGMNGEGHCG